MRNIHIYLARRVECAPEREFVVGILQETADGQATEQTIAVVESALDALHIAFESAARWSVPVSPIVEAYDLDVGPRPEHAIDLARFLVRHYNTELLQDYVYYGDT